MIRTTPLLLLLLPLLLVGCGYNAAVVVTHGESTVNIGPQLALGGKQYNRVAVAKNGTLTITRRDDYTESFRDGATAGVTAYGLGRTAATRMAEFAKDEAIAISANKTQVAGQAIGASVEKAAIAADVTKATTLPK